MSESPAQVFARNQLAYEKQIRDALRVAASDATKRINALENGVRAGQLERSRAIMRAVERNLFAEILQILETGQSDMARQASLALSTSDEPVLEKAFGKPFARAVREVATAQAQSGIEAMVTRLVSSRLPLSGRVYRTAAIANGWVDQQINTALAQGSSARELAARVRASILPDTPGGTSFAAMRLARTELNNAFHAGAIRHAQTVPWIDGLQWHLSGSHPKPDACDDYADKVFAPDEVPRKPHPQCLCYTTAAMPDEDTFLDSLVRGQYDDYLKLAPGFDTVNMATILTTDEKKLRAAFNEFKRTAPDFEDHNIVFLAARKLGWSDERAFAAFDSWQAKIGTRVISAGKTVKVARVAKGAVTQTSKLGRASKSLTPKFKNHMERSLQAMVANVADDPEALAALEKAFGRLDVGPMRKDDKLKNMAVAHHTTKFDGGLMPMRINLDYDVAIENVVLRNRHGRWWSEGTDAGWDQTFKHEFGHHVDGMLANQRIDQYVALRNVIFREMGIDQRAVYISDAQAVFERNKFIMERLSKYGAKNDREFVAEMWAEYNGGRPRQFVIRIGDELVKMLKDSTYLPDVRL